MSTLKAQADVFSRVRLQDVLAYTAPGNARSQAVMTRLGLQGDSARDFTAQYDGTGAWRGLVWVAKP